MQVRIPPKYSVSEIMGYLKGKSSPIIFDRHANLKYKYGSRHFCCRGYYVDTVGKNAKKETGIHPKATTRGCHRRPDKHERVHRPVYG